MDKVMQVQLYYDQNEDRILLKLDTADQVLVSWLTRRQCLFLIQKGQELQSRLSEKAASTLPGKNRLAATREKASVISKYAGQAGKAKNLKCTMSDKAVKISFAADDSGANINLQLREGDLQAFIGMLMELAFKANWGLPEALERMEAEKQNDKVKKTLH